MKRSLQNADSLSAARSQLSQPLGSLGNVLIVGVGKSGQATARFLCEHAGSLGLSSLTVVDSAPSDTFDSFLHALEELTEEKPHRMHIRASFDTKQVPELGDDSLYDLCIITPGLAPHTTLSRSAYAHSREVISEIELAFRLSPPGLNWVAITGTNGKTTTTELVREVLSAGMQGESRANQVYSVGNIGTPALELLAQVQDGDAFVAEVSSFQAARLADFKPRVAALLNLSADHLDWHKDIASYAADKCAIFANSAQGDLVLVPEESLLHEQARPVISAALEAASARGAKIRTVQADETSLPLAASELAVQGKHNLLNACFAAEIARYFKMSDADIATALKFFKSPPHRMQELGRFNDVLYVNDSKATNPDASIQALSAYPGLEMTLLLGGQSKGELGADYLDLAKVALGRAQNIYLFGQSALALRDVFENCATDCLPQQHVTVFESMEKAVEAAVESAVPEQVVLLSPANASFDEFANYEERGREFERLVGKFHGTAANSSESSEAKDA